MIYHTIYWSMATPLYIACFWRYLLAEEQAVAIHKV